jgi:hypothetical protein
MGVLATAGCKTTPADPDLPTLEERPLVEKAILWCEEARAPAGPPTKPFFTDGCSAWPDGILYDCCVEHDIAYWCGGSEADRLHADSAFRVCADAVGSSQGGLVHRGVRMGGVPWLPTSWRWGYGHAFGTGYVEPDEPDGAAGMIEAEAPPEIVPAERAP